jgi:uncharacterized protein YjbJ (UPF0337 family)
LDPNATKGEIMNEDTLKGKWNQIKGRVRSQWGKLTDDEIDQIQGRKDILVGKLQEKYGYTHERAEQEVDHFLGGDFDTDMGMDRPSMR